LTKIAILDDYQNVALEMADWRSLPSDATVDVFAEHVFDEDRLAARLGAYGVIVAMRERTPFPRSLLEHLPELGLLVTTGMRNASIDVDAATELGITVCGTEGLGYPTAELTWGLILAIARRVPEEDKATREGRWQVTLGEGLNGKVLGVIGLGRLGSQVAMVGKAFGMEVIAWSQNLTRERTDEIGATLVSKEDLLARSDYVTIHLVLSDRTRGLLGASELNSMKPTAYLINTSRGPIVDEAALVEAVQTGKIAGAGLDVFDQEPLAANHPLRDLENTVITPHMGYVTSETYAIFYGHALENIQAFLAGAPIRTINQPRAAR
jgi:phosphoglycerate dehydrogenase-like enzyme|tara:strand:- start:1454 stop:2422 length:969 start_codon:yes stop_codon:yes gene_type:complete